MRQIGVFHLTSMGKHILTNHQLLWNINQERGSKVRKFTSFLIIFIVFFILQGCVGHYSFLSSPNKLHSDNQNDIVTLIFSDPGKLPYEGSYYDALLSLQSTIGYEVTELIVCESSDRSTVNYYKVEEFPTMLVYVGDDEKIRVSGEQSQQDISHQLNNLFH